MLELIGLVAGLLIGAFFPWTIPAQWSLYVAAGLLAALDSALGGFRARVKGEFKLGVFLSGTIGSVITLKEVPNTSTCNFPISTIKG